MRKTHFFFSFLLAVPAMVFPGEESYSELMDRAEKLTAQRYERTSRAFKITSDELDAILDSKESKEEKIKHLKELISKLEKLENQIPEKKSSPAQEKSGNSFLQEIKEKAEKGDPDALYRLGMIYWEGKQQPRSLTRALRCFRKSAAQNHLPSRFMLALADLNGKGVIPDAKKAFRQFRKLYQEGFTPAGIPLGIQYYEGRGTGKNYALAVECLLKGMPGKTEIPADFAPEAALGKMYYHGGFGIQPDPVRAVRFLKQAAEDPEAQFLLGGLCLNGTGTPKNVSEAAECFRRAAEKGHIPAGFELGRMYRLGLGVKKDDASAVRYLNP
ncbi:MAG: SEL1-like repeat protein, partial [Lentisphaeria bacterium]|nr:SEL1-like repeat protein [Lentisphaeria bacterium]